MGYYDQNDENQNKRKKSHTSYFLAGLGGAIIGALLILLAFPGSGLLNNDENEITTEKSTGSESTEQAQQNLTVDVTSAVTNAVDKASDAVVGITNIQETNFWGQGSNAEDSSAEAGTGSGVVYKKDGGKAYIVTNNQVLVEFD